MRQVGGDGDHGFRSAPDEPQRLGDPARLGFADENGQDFERRRQHRLQHHQMHFERMFAGEGAWVDGDGFRFGEARMQIRGDFRFAERGAPGLGRM